ncbi:MAG: hypothetical protein WC548_02345 [Candidatus Pacearchaeota archaeon]
MKWVKFVVLVQAILVLIFIVTFFFEKSLDDAEGGEDKASIDKGYLPSSDTFDFAGLSKITVLLIVIAIIELIVLTRMFE